MKHRIDPKVDCVFKAILGTEDNRHLLVHFLNAILGAELPSPITSVELLNPASDREFDNDKLHIVDVKARDHFSRLFQIEIQMAREPDLSQRMIYCWADLYAKQINRGDRYVKLQHAYSIWLLDAELTPHDEPPIHRYKLRDEFNQTLIEHGGIWMIELTKCQLAEVATEQQRWLKLFVEGETLNDVDLPNWMQTPEMRKAMKVLHDFSEKEENYHIYASRLDYERRQRTQDEFNDMQRDRDLALLNLTNAENRAAQAEQHIQALQAEIERLKSTRR